jgi:hypothetical protein
MSNQKYFWAIAKFLLFIGMSLLISLSLLQAFKR